jgi:hypothetical protein
MKFLLFLLLFTSSFVSWSQTAYGSISGGYQFGVGKQNLEHHSASDFFEFNTWSWSKVDLSLGKGAMTNFALGYDFNQHYGVAVSSSYLYGAEFSSKDNNYQNTTYERKLSATMIRINPSFRMYVGENRFRTYADIGFILGIGKVNFTYRGYTVDTTRVEYNYIYVGGLSFGASARFGVEYNLSKRFLIFGEFNFISQAYAPEKGHLTKHIQNNVDMTESSQQSPYLSEIIFVEELQGDPTLAPDFNKPSLRAKHSYPFHSYGFNFGLKYILWTKSKEERGIL